MQPAHRLHDALLGNQTIAPGSVENAHDLAATSVKLAGGYEIGATDFFGVGALVKGTSLFR